MESLNGKIALVRGCLCFLDSSKNTDILLGEAITSATYLINREAGELDMSGQQFGSEDVFTEIPNQSSSAEGVLNLEPDPFMKRLPHRHNRLFLTCAGSLTDPRWKAAMNEEMKSLQKNETWNSMHGVRKAMSEGVQIEEVIVWVEAIPETWFGRFTKSMRAFGYRQITGNDPEERKALQNYLSREFEMKDLGDWNVGCQPVNTPIEEVMRILRYLKNAPRKGILFAKNVDHQSIEVYTDADWASVMYDRRSTSGYFTFVGGNLVTWKSYLSRQPIRLFCDNKVACDIAHNPVQHDRTKHVEVDRFFIKEKLDDKIVELPKIRSENQLVDILTKAVSSQVFSKFLDKLGMCDIYAPT
ncbi:hypothetical protein CK203_017584 [Vitis vinifera]|uniref:Retrovirus-related Pol polyprotein from transposon RE1 n=1 Tax=Vitis vinifera TaxID=29760 RepID=A0A438IXL8_VITVI|nr:hypothetical protein CK203_017584 [Vitis vinifera]